MLASVDGVAPPTGALASGAADLVEHGGVTGTADFGGGPVTANGDAGATVTSFLLGLRP